MFSSSVFSACFVSLRTSREVIPSSRVCLCRPASLSGMGVEFSFESGRGPKLLQFCSTSKGVMTPTRDRSLADRSKLIFLDVDGVLHPTRGKEEFSIPCMKELCRIVKETGAAICLSTSWRLVPVALEFLIKQLHTWGLPPHIGCTPQANKIEHAFWQFCGEQGPARPKEIISWLADHKSSIDFPRWVAIDDIDMTDELKPHFVHTDKRAGLTPFDADHAIGVLNSVGICDCEICSVLDDASY